MYPEKFNVPGVETPESFIVLYDNAGEPLAAICCKYTATGGGEASEVSITSTDGTAEIVNDLSQTTLTPGSLSSLVESGFGMGAPGAEFVIMASEAESYFTTSFSFANIFVLTTDGQLVESPAGFSVYASSNTTFRVTASADAEYLLLFMDANGGLPAVAYYSYEEGGSQGGDVVIPEPTTPCAPLMTYPDCSLVPMAGDNPMKAVLYEKYQTPNIYHLTMKGNYDAGISFQDPNHLKTVAVDPNTYEPVTVTIMGGSMNFLVQKPTSYREVLLVLSSASDEVLGVIYYTHEI